MLAYILSTSFLHSIRCPPAVRRVHSSCQDNGPLLQGRTKALQQRTGRQVCRDPPNAHYNADMSQILAASCPARRCCLPKTASSATSIPHTIRCDRYLRSFMTGSIVSRGDPTGQSRQAEAVSHTQTARGGRNKRDAHCSWLLPELQASNGTRTSSPRDRAVTCRHREAACCQQGLWSQLWVFKRYDGS